MKPTTVQSITQITGLALLATVLFLVVRAVVNKAKKEKDESRGSTVPVNQSFLDPNRNYDALVQQMYSAIDGLTDTAADKARAMENWMDSNDEEFKHLCNIYNQRFAKAPDTIRQDLEGEWAINPWKLGKFTARLDRLELA